MRGVKIILAGKLRLSMRHIMRREVSLAPLLEEMMRLENHLKEDVQIR